MPSVLIAMFFTFSLFIYLITMMVTAIMFGSYMHEDMQLRASIRKLNEIIEAAK